MQTHLPYDVAEQNRSLICINEITDITIKSIPVNSTYFRNLTFRSSVLIPYYTTTGTYAYGSNSLNVSGTLNPMVGRVRFKGTYGTYVSVRGLAYCSSYDNTTGEFQKSTTAKSMYVNYNGYTDYMYCEKAVGSKALVLTISSQQYAMPLTDNGLSVKWASTNLGATYSYNYGGYYAWGETKAYNETDISNFHNYLYSNSYVKTDFSWNTYKYTSGNYIYLPKAGIERKIGSMILKSLFGK